jgi:hypothetical protein
MRARSTKSSSNKKAARKTIMARKALPKMKGVRVFPPPPKGFDGLTATKADLARHGLPPRPDPRTQPALAALWEQYARRYRDFEHLAPKLLPPKKLPTPLAAGLGLSPLQSCGFELNVSAPITTLSGTWTVPNLNYSPNSGLPDTFIIFFGLGLLDVHTEMTVDPAQNVTAQILIQGVGQVALSVRPGDTRSGPLSADRPTPPGPRSSVSSMRQRCKLCTSRRIPGSRRPSQST